MLNKFIAFYIHGSVHHNSILIRSNKMQQYAGIYLLLLRPLWFDRKHYESGFTSSFKECWFNAGSSLLAIAARTAVIAAGMLPPGSTVTCDVSIVNRR
jgi:hypothetical protein